VHVRGKPVAPDVDLENVARQTPGFVGADLENVVNEAAILAARRSKRSIGMGELQEAVERIAMGGPERRSRLISEREKRIIAYHEAGHALVAYLSGSSDAIQKITIVPRGATGGYVWRVSEHDAVLQNRSYFQERIAVFLGGRVAEEIVFGEITTGASGDIQTLTNIARAMVTKFGMSETMGALQFGQQDELVFLGRELAEQRDYSEEVAEQIDAEVRRLVSDAHARVRALLATNLDKLHAIARALLERETLNNDELTAIITAA
jgi:cell division protease FtsH